MPETLSFDERALFQVCTEIETLAAELYTLFAMAHAGDSAMLQLWRKTASEEMNHAQQFELALRLRQAIVSEVRVAVEEAAEIRERLRSTIASARKAPLGIVDALKLAVDLEGRLAEFHMVQAVAFKDPQNTKLFRALQAADKAHVESLDVELKRRGAATP